MAFRTGPLLAATLLSMTACAAAPGEGSRVPVPVAPPGTVISMVSQSDTTVTGQPLAPVAAPWVALFSRTELPPGAALPMHKHPWPRYAFVISGRLRVHYEESGLVREFGPGEAVVEAVDQWHEARVLGDEPVLLYLFDQVPPGRTNVITR